MKKILLISLTILFLVLLTWYMTSQCKYGRYLYLDGVSNGVEMVKDCKCSGFEFNVPNTDGFVTMCTGLNLQKSDTL